MDEVLADALTAQGEAGVRALGLLRDAHRVLTGTDFVRPAEVAAACVRSVADALLGLPGAPVTVGLKPAAQGLLAAVDAAAPPAVEVSGPDEPADDTPPADEASPLTAEDSEPHGRSYWPAPRPRLVRHPRPTGRPSKPVRPATPPGWVRRGHG
ncbi:hypothetical protein [Streptomyces sp. NPDC001381]|uniref:hypothetical protein n=1 Tax=Streptomyces sp. NPDC001381 TaxID=3364567 RepID=UPI0036979A3F